MMEVDFFAVSTAMERYETVLFDTLSLLRCISISDSLTKFGLITYNCLCNKNRYTSCKSTVLFGCSRLNYLLCFCACVHVCVRVCVRGVSKAWQPTLYLLFIVTTELYNWGHQNYTYHRQFKLRNSIKLWNMVTVSVFLHYTLAQQFPHI